MTNKQLLKKGVFMGYCTDVRGEIITDFTTADKHLHALKLINGSIIPTGNEKNLEIESELKELIKSCNLVHTEGFIASKGEWPGDEWSYKIIKGKVIKTKVEITDNTNKFIAYLKDCNKDHLTEIEKLENKIKKNKQTINKLNNF